jgi:hypothetical protein
MGAIGAQVRRQRLEAAAQRRVVIGAERVARDATGRLGRRRAQERRERAMQDVGVRIPP